MCKAMFIRGINQLMYKWIFRSSCRNVIIQSIVGLTLHSRHVAEKMLWMEFLCIPLRESSNMMGDSSMNTAHTLCSMSALVQQTRLLMAYIGYQHIQSSMMSWVISPSLSLWTFQMQDQTCSYIWHEIKENHILV